MNILSIFMGGIRGCSYQRGLALVKLGILSSQLKSLVYDVLILYTGGGSTVVENHWRLAVAWDSLLACCACLKCAHRLLRIIVKLLIVGFRNIQRLDSLDTLIFL